MDKVYSIDEIKHLVAPLLERYGASGASLFSSYARGEATADSDLDVIVRGGSFFYMTDIFAIAEDLYEASGKRVDVYEESEIDTSTEFGKRVAADRLVLL